jgi:maleylacetoacetate isomerase/maleylpyruvate isomerase
MGGVPTLVHNNVTLAQSTAILEYLDEAFPETTQLLPQDVITRAHIRQFCQNINSDIHPYANLKTTARLEKTFHISEAQKIEWIQYWCEQGLTACEKMLQGHNSTYCFGENITMADVLLIPMLFSAQRFQVDIKKFPTLNKINENCLKLDAFIKTHPFRQVDTPDELRIK